MSSKLKLLKERILGETDEQKLKLIYGWVKQNHISLSEFKELVKESEPLSKPLRENCEYNYHDQCECMGKFCKYGT